MEQTSDFQGSQDDHSPQEQQVAKFLEQGPVVHDRRGDLNLTVGQDHPDEKGGENFLVCSRTLARCSSVFDRMLYGHMAESKQENKDSWTVILLEDDPDAFELWSSICHGQLNDIPPTLSVDCLFELTSLTHYYDTTHMLSPWIEKWTNSLSQPPATSEISMHKMLWISLELGQIHLATATARSIILESPGQLSEEELQEALGKVPLQDLISRLCKIRLQTLSAMLNLFKSFADLLVVVDEKPRWCRHATYMGPHRCESMILGSIVFCLTRAGLWPLPPAEELQDSVLGLYKKLTGIIVHDIGQPEKKGDNHSDCNPRQFLMERLRRVLADRSDALSEEELAAVERQAVRFGFEDNTRGR